MTNLLHLYFSNSKGIVLEVSPRLVIAGIVIVATLVAVRLLTGRSLLGRFRPVEVEIALGGVGRVRLRPNTQDVQIAHKVWTELVTRKAALPIDEENDLIADIYDSWYEMFGRVRTLVGEIPSDLIRSEASTQEIVRICTETLNRGLRPHLTKWQARFRDWYEHHRDELKGKTPQEAQREYPEYEKLMAELQEVNQQLIAYAAALRKIAQGK